MVTPFTKLMYRLVLLKLVISIPRRRAVIC